MIAALWQCKKRRVDHVCGSGVAATCEMYGPAVFKFNLHV